MMLCKRLGQHFLRDQAVIQHIVTALAPQPTDHLLEIGPGDGALTFPVLSKATALAVIEYDRRLIPLLQQRALSIGTLVIHVADALQFDFDAVKQTDRLLRLFGNIPYQISTPLIFHLLRFAPMMQDMLLMVQKEVADRLVAPVHAKQYGRLSVMVQYYCRVERLFDVSPHAFYPPPQVESSVVRLMPHRGGEPVAQDHALFAAIVKQAFHQRRKMLRNSLQALVQAETWEQMGMDARRRAENLSVQDFVAMSNAIARKG